MWTSCISQASFDYDLPPSVPEHDEALSTDRYFELLVEEGESNDWYPSVHTEDVL